jgi:hypothetical protein
MTVFNYLYPYPSAIKSVLCQLEGALQPAVAYAMSMRMPECGNSLHRSSNTRN